MGQRVCWACSVNDLSFWMHIYGPSHCKFAGSPVLLTSHLRHICLFSCTPHSEHQSQWTSPCTWRPAGNAFWCWYRSRRSSAYTLGYGGPLVLKPQSPSAGHCYCSHPGASRSCLGMFSSHSSHEGWSSYCCHRIQLFVRQHKKSGLLYAVSRQLLIHDLTEYFLLIYYKLKKTSLNNCIVPFRKHDHHTNHFPFKTLHDFIYSCGRFS